MKKTMTILAIPALVFVLAAAAGSANAALTIAVEEVGDDVVFSWGGTGQSLDLTSLNVDITMPTANVNGKIHPKDTSYSFLSTLQGLNVDGLKEVGTLTFYPFGDGNETSGGTPSGSALGLLSLGGPILLVLDEDYTSEAEYAEGSLTFAGTTLDALGVTVTETPSTIAAWTSDSISMVLIPEPATMSLLAIGGIALIRRRRK